MRWLICSCVILMRSSTARMVLTLVSATLASLFSQSFSNPPSQKFMDLTPDDPYANFVLDSYRIDYDIGEVEILPAANVTDTDDITAVERARAGLEAQAGQGRRG